MNIIMCMQGGSRCVREVDVQVIAQLTPLHYNNNECHTLRMTCVRIEST